MKKNLHPEYRPVVFRDKSLRDKSGDYAFLTRSTRASAQTIEWTDGRVYPVVDVDVSSASHPFYTGRGRVMDTAGRVERFKQRYGTK